jgi:hypothetical protein
MRVPREIGVLRIVARGDTGSLTCETRAIAGPAPASAFVTAPGRDGEAVTVIAAGFAGPTPADPCSVDGAAVVRRARTRFEGGERLYLPMPLRHACVNVTCPEGETCAAGQCVSAEIGSGGLVTFDPSLASADGSFCFPSSRCFEDVSPAVLADLASCTFQLPDEVPDDAKNRGFGNIQILHDDLSREVLDLDSVEGFTRVPGHNDRFRLAPALCDRYRARVIASLYLGANCPPKEALRAMCAAPVREGDPPLEDVLCTSPRELAPSPAAVYLLVDRSNAMRDELPPLREAIDLALQAPFVRNTRVGLRLLPASPAACGASPSPFASFAGPDAVPFAAPLDARAPVSAILADSAVLPDNPPLYIDAALRQDGAYLGVSAASQGFVRRYVVAMGNRDFVDHCKPGVGTPVQNAFVSSRDRAITTAALIVAAPAGTDQGGHDPFLDALAMARAGGGPFGDGTYDLRGLRAAVAAFITEVATCLYDLPPGIDTSGDLSKVKVSYFNVLNSNRVDLAYDAACVNGWRIENGHVHLCGAACNDLHFEVSTTAAYALDRGLLPVEAPMRWAAPCN